MERLATVNECRPGTRHVLGTTYFSKGGAPLNRLAVGDREIQVGWQMIHRCKNVDPKNKKR